MEGYRELKRIWQRLMLPFVIPVLLAFAWLVGQNVGFPRTVEQTMPASIFTQDKELIAVDVTLKATYTNYPLKKGKTGAEDRVEAYVGERCVARIPWQSNDPDGVKFQVILDPDSTAVVSTGLDVLLVEQDLSRVLPGRTAQRCVIVAPEMELHEAVSLLEELSPATRAEFAWLEALAQ